MTTTRRYQVGSEFNLPAVLNQAHALAKRAAKRGLSGGYTVTTETAVEIGPEGTLVEQAYVTITGEPVRYNGWSFVAKVEWDNHLPVVSGSPWYEGRLVDRSALIENWCDHCQTNRRRSKAIVVENEDGTVRRQVGSSCVQDFLGATVKPSWYSDADPFDALDRFRGAGAPMARVDAVLAAAACAARQGGYRKANDAGGSTASDVRAILGWASAVEIEAALRDLGSPTPQDYVTAKAAWRWGRESAGTSEWAENLRAVLAGEWIPAKRIGLAVSAIGGYLREQGAQAEAKAGVEVTHETLYAEPGTKIEVADAVVVKAIPVETAYGWSTIFVLAGEGYRFKWFTASGPELREGDRVSFKATVKGLDTYNGETSTAVLRVKFQSAAVAA